jgi:hypothetical protein
MSHYCTPISICASDAPQGLIVPNAYTEKATMVVVESGEKNITTWVDEEKDICPEYRNAFKDDRP